MHYIQLIESWLLNLADKIPVEWFTFLGAAIEEVIAPIPSPIVMTLAGSVASAQHKGYIYLAVLALIGAVGKTLASVIVYVVSDKAEDIVVGKFGKYLGVSNKEIEKIGKYFSHGGRDFWMMFLARALPIMPTAPVSIVSGVVKVPMKMYAWGTFFGTFVRSAFYLALGYLGTASFEGLLAGLDSMETLVQLILAVVGIALLAIFYYRREHESDIMGLIRRWFRMK